MSSYTTNTTLAEIADKIRGVVATGGKIAVMTHSKPDGDAAGSSLGVARAIAQIGGDVEVWHAGAIPAWVPALFASTPLTLVDKTGIPAADYALALVLDTGAWSQLENTKAFLAPRTAANIVIDHHRHGDADVAAMRFVDTGAAAVCEIAAELCRLIVKVDSVTKLKKDIAHPLYLGMATDTGWFRHSNVTGRLLRAAADCVEAGAEPSMLYQLTEQQDRPQRLKLLSRALASMELHASNAVAILSLTKEDFAATGAEISETGGFVDFPALIPNVRVVAVLTETQDAQGKPLTKISFRSKAGNNAVDVNTIAQKFGGGGHFAAAGGRTPLPLGEAKAAVIAALSQAVK